MTPVWIKNIIPYLRPFYTGLCFFLLFAGYQTTQNYQSGINETDGYISVALIYGFFGIGQFFTPAIIYFVSAKYSLFYSGLCYVFYIATNVYLIKSLYFVASAVCGLGAALLWSAASVLLSGYEQHCSKQSFCYTSFYLPYYSFFIGNFISLIFDPSTKELMFTVLTIVCSLAVIMFLFVPDSPPIPPESITKVILSTLKSFGIIPLMLLFPIAISFGVSLSFYYTTMPTLMPISMTAYIYICMGVAMTVSTFIWGFLVRKFTERWVLFFPMLSSIISAILGLILDQCELSTTAQNVIVCILGAFSGISDSGIDSIMTALVNKVWPKEVAPLCAWRIVYLASMCIALLYSAFINRTIVIIVVLIISFLSTLSLIVVIVLYKKVFKPVQKKNTQRVKELEEQEGGMDVKTQQDGSHGIELEDANEEKQSKIGSGKRIDDEIKDDETNKQENETGDVIIHSIDLNGYEKENTPDSSSEIEL